MRAAPAGARAASWPREGTGSQEEGAARCWLKQRAGQWPSGTDSGSIQQGHGPWRGRWRDPAQGVRCCREVTGREPASRAPHEPAGAARSPEPSVARRADTAHPPPPSDWPAGNLPGKAARGRAGSPRVTIETEAAVLHLLLWSLDRGSTPETNEASSASAGGRRGVEDVAERFPAHDRGGEQHIQRSVWESARRPRRPPSARRGPSLWWGDQVPAPAAADTSRRSSARLHAKTRIPLGALRIGI